MSGETKHFPGVKPPAGEGYDSKLRVPICSCGWEGEATMSIKGAQAAAERHARSAA